MATSFSVLITRPPCLHNCNKLAANQSHITGSYCQGDPSSLKWEPVITQALGQTGGCRTHSSENQGPKAMQHSTGKSSPSPFPMGWMVTPQKICPRSNSQNLWALPYLEKGLCKCSWVKDLEIKTYPGLSGKALNPVTSILIRGTQGRQKRRQTQRRRQQEDWRGGWSAAATN